jgi:hypothetical protein
MTILITQQAASPEGTGNHKIQFATDSGGANVTGTIGGSITLATHLLREDFLWNG